MIKFIYFDLGGVFFHWRSGLKILAERFGKTYEEFNQVRVKYDDSVCRGKMSPQELWQKYQEELHFQAPTDFNFPKDWVKTFQLIVETHDLVRRLVNRYRVGILTNVYPEIYDLQKSYGLVPDLNYQVVIRSDKLGIVKPDPEIFQIANQRSEVLPGNIFYTDDIKENIKTAEMFGWQTIWFDENNPGQSVEKIRKCLG